MKNALFLFGLLVGISSYGQFNHIQYKTDCDAAYRTAIDDSNYLKSLSTLSKVEKKYGKLYCEEYILMAYCYKKLGKETKSAKCLRSAWSNYGFDMACLTQIKQIDLGEINRGYTAKQQKLVQEGFKNFAKLKRSNTDSLMLVLQIMLEADQVPRMKFYSDAPIDTIAVNREMAQTDSINFIAFKNIIYKLGYPGEWILPGNSSQVFVLLVHSSYNQSFFDEMKDVLLQEVQEGRMPPSYYALWLDRHHSVTNLPQHYGMLAIKDNLNLSEKQKQDIQSARLKIGLIKNCPIPTQLLMFQ